MYHIINESAYQAYETSDPREALRLPSGSDPVELEAIRQKLHAENNWTHSSVWDPSSNLDFTTETPESYTAFGKTFPKPKPLPTLPLLHKDRAVHQIRALLPTLETHVSLLGDATYFHKELGWSPLTMAEKPWLEALHQHLVDFIDTAKSILATQPK